ncbi:MAG: RDD family protein [Betaproteobacteria bacterium]|nr:RDD family protein [Betaproteobacteria bacterium]MDE2623150.1 RDD family protein [Betaproteobacteria bacterium]
MDPPAAGRARNGAKEFQAVPSPAAREKSRSKIPLARRPSRSRKHATAAGGQPHTRAGARSPVTPARTPLWPRLVCMVYEALIVAGLLMAAGLPFVMLTHYSAHPELRPFYQGYLFAVLGLYFSYFWHRSGQTVPMKTWHLRLVDRVGSPPSWGLAFARYLLAWPGWLTGASLVWALVDREGRFLHDRLLGLRLVRESS